MIRDDVLTGSICADLDHKWAVQRLDELIDAGAPFEDVVETIRLIDHCEWMMRRSAAALQDDIDSIDAILNDEESPYNRDESGNVMSDKWRRSLRGDALVADLTINFDMAQREDGSWVRFSDGGAIRSQAYRGI